MEEVDNVTTKKFAANILCFYAIVLFYFSLKVNNVECILIDICLYKLCFTHSSAMRILLRVWM